VAGLARELLGVQLHRQAADVVREGVALGLAAVQLCEEQGTTVGARVAVWV
jgi:hypothetical protein